MPSVFTFQRRVEFCETDAAGIAHFSALIIYMEQAEHALLRSLGLSVSATDASTNSILSWPRVRVECDFHSPAKFEDLISSQVGVSSLGTKSITFQHQLSIGNTVIAIGKMTSVCCAKDNGTLSSVKIPLHVRELLVPYL